MTETSRSPLLSTRRLHKSYGHVTALAGVDMDIHAGEVVALVGDNGAGKSTLVKILSGAIMPTSGAITMSGADLTFGSPRDAAAHGIQTVYQDLALAGDMSIASNIYLGREMGRPGLAGRLGFLDYGAMRRGADATLARLDIRLKSVDTEVRALSGGQRQSVAIARALAWASKIVLLDEPTAALGVAQTRQVLELVRRVRDLGLGVVLISHNMQDVLSVADRVVVLRLGAKAAEFTAGNFSIDQLVAAITGADRFLAGG
ncbi:ATP-binding cassette domain-containing protein [Mesorhizobium sp. CN2-181]